MIIYRPHRSTLSEALEKAREFKTEEEMKEYIYQDHKRYFEEIGFSRSPFEISDIVIDKSDAHDDERCGWHDTMYVCVKRYGDKDYTKLYGCPQCIGMCATDYGDTILYDYLN